MLKVLLNLLSSKESSNAMADSASSSPVPSASESSRRVEGDYFTVAQSSRAARLSTSTLRRSSSNTSLSSISSVDSLNGESTLVRDLDVQAALDEHADGRSRSVELVPHDSDASLFSEKCGASSSCPSPAPGAGSQPSLSASALPISSNSAFVSRDLSCKSPHHNESPEVADILTPLPYSSAAPSWSSPQESPTDFVARCSLQSPSQSPGLISEPLRSSCSSMPSHSPAPAPRLPPKSPQTPSLYHYQMQQYPSVGVTPPHGRRQAVRVCQDDDEELSRLRASTEDEHEPNESERNVRPRSSLSRAEDAASGAFRPIQQQQSPLDRLGKAGFARPSSSPSSRTSRSLLNSMNEGSRMSPLDSPPPLFSAPSAMVRASSFHSPSVRETSSMSGRTMSVVAAANHAAAAQGMSVSICPPSRATSAIDQRAHLLNAAPHVDSPEIVSINSFRRELSVSVPLTPLTPTLSHFQIDVQSGQAAERMRIAASPSTPMSSELQAFHISTPTASSAACVTPFWPTVSSNSLQRAASAPLIADSMGHQYIGSPVAFSNTPVQSRPSPSPAGFESRRSAGGYSASAAGSSSGLGKRGRLQLSVNVSSNLPSCRSTLSDRQSAPAALTPEAPTASTSTSARVLPSPPPLAPPLMMPIPSICTFAVPAACPRPFCAPRAKSTSTTSSASFSSIDSSLQSDSSSSFVAFGSRDADGSSSGRTRVDSTTSSDCSMEHAPTASQTCLTWHRPSTALNPGQNSAFSPAIGASQRLQHSASAPELHDIDLKDSELPDRQQQSTPFDDLVQRSVTPTGEEYERKLPCISSNRISPSTLAAVLEGRYDQQYDRMCVVDCRFDYEFRGGHVRNAISVTEPDQLEAMFFPPDQTQQLMDVRTLVVFHCEFSQVRGPKQMEHLRLLDRTRVGYDRHPLLNYPEVYLLDGGYKRFFLEYPQLCEPRAYVTMDSDDRSGRLMSHCHQLWRSRSASSTPVRGSRSFTQPDAVPSFQPGAGQVRSFQRSQSCRGLMDSDKFAAAAAGTDKMQLSFMSIPSNATSLSIPFTRSAPLPVSSPLPIFSAPTAVPSVRHVPTAFASPTPAPVSAPGLTPAPAPATPQSDSLNSSFSSAAFPSPLPSPSTAAAAAFMQQVASPSDSSSPVSSMESPVGFSNFTPVQKVLEQPSVDDPMEDESSHDAIFCAKLAFHAE